jgi:ribose transport system permease protein
MQRIPKAKGLVNEFAIIWLATALLFVVSAFFKGGLTRVSLLSMLPYASILAIAAIGQTFVVQQGGIDFTVVGVIDLSTVVISKFPSSHPGDLVLALILVAFIGIASGVIVGSCVTKLNISPLIASLGVNALLVGFAQSYSNGTPSTTPKSLTTLATGRVAGIPNLLIAAIVVTAVISFLMHRTVVGRRLTLVGESRRAARGMGLPVDLYAIGAYAAAGLCYAAAGVALAAFTSTPDISAGDTYLLGTIAAVAIAGNPLSGGKASVIATAGGALFLSQLDQLSLSLGAPTSVQYVLQSVAIAVGMGLRLVPRYVDRRKLKIETRPPARLGPTEA